MTQEEIERDRFTFYRSFREAIEQLPPEEQLPMFKAISDFALDGVEPNPQPLGALAWTLIRPILAKGRGNATGGLNSTGQRPTMAGNQNAAKDKQQSNNSQTTVKQQERKGGDMIIEGMGGGKPPRSRARAKGFAPPTVEEVAAYACDAGLKMDAARFVDYYTSNGWKAGRVPMKDWKAAARNWSRRDGELGTAPASPAQQPPIMKPARDDW